MSRPYTPWQGTATEDRHDDAVAVDDHRHGYWSPPPGDYLDDEYDDFELDDEPDRRWLWVAAVAAVILLAAVIATVAVVSGGDSGSVSATVAPPSKTTPSAVASSTAKATVPPAPATPLAPETVSTVTPSAGPSETASAEAPTEAAPPPPAADPRTVVYTVTGTTQLVDLVTIIYTDQQGALQTDLNVALPWSKTVVLNPGVELSSVTATSLTGHLNCSITDGAGGTIAAQNNNTLIANCTK
jgi:MmpS family membrane protein